METELKTYLILFVYRGKLKDTYVTACSVSEAANIFYCGNDWDAILDIKEVSE